MRNDSEPGSAAGLAAYPADGELEPNNAQGGSDFWLDVVSLLFVLLVICALLLML